MQWDDAKQILTIGERQGQNFPAHAETRTFRVIFAGENHGAGIGQSAQADKVVSYDGKRISRICFRTRP